MPTLPRELARRTTANSVVRVVQIDNTTFRYEKQAPSVDALGEHQTPWVPAVATDMPEDFLLRQLLMKLDEDEAAQWWPLTVTE